MSNVVERLKASGLVEQRSPHPCPGGYVFHAYCRWENPEHGFREFPHEADQVENLRAARAQLRASGWIFHDDEELSLATCPKCARRLKRTAQ